MIGHGAMKNKIAFMGLGILVVLAIFGKSAVD
jgi:hypothetical protein